MTEIKKLIVFASVFVVGVGAAVYQPCYAALVFSVDSKTDGTVFAVSSTDLLQTHLSSTTSVGDFAVFSAGGLGQLRNGSFGPSGVGTGFTPAWNASATVGGGSGTGTQITYNFDLVSSPVGYQINQIDTYTGWDSGRDGQRYTVLYSEVSNPLVFQTLGSFNNNFDTLSSGVGNSHGNRRVRLLNTDGFIATNVAAIRFNFQDAENGWTAYREIDVFGIQAVPEPSAFVLVGIAICGLVLRRARPRTNV